MFPLTVFNTCNIREGRIFYIKLNPLLWNLSLKLDTQRNNMVLSSQQVQIPITGILSQFITIGVSGP